MGWAHAPRTGIWKFISHHFLGLLAFFSVLSGFILIWVGLGWGLGEIGFFCFVFFPPENVNELAAVFSALPRSRKVAGTFLPQPGARAEELLHGPGTAQMCSLQTHILSGDPIFPFFLQFLSSFYFFFYSLINTGNELHMATAFTSLCEICSSCIVYQFNMFTTDAISVWQLSCLKSLFPTRYVLPQPSHLLSNMHHCNLPPFPDWCHTQAERSNLLEIWTLCGHSSWWKVLRYYCIFTPTKRKVNWPPRVRMREN